jgi:hypothetical protein
VLTRLGDQPCLEVKKDLAALEGERLAVARPYPLVASCGAKLNRFFGSSSPWAARWSISPGCLAPAEAAVTRPSPSGRQRPPPFRAKAS